jgi:hypothetical protein
MKWWKIFEKSGSRGRFAGRSNPPPSSSLPAKGKQAGRLVKEGEKTHLSLIRFWWKKNAAAGSSVILNDLPLIRFWWKKNARAAVINVIASESFSRERQRGGKQSH